MLGETIILGGMFISAFFIAKAITEAYQIDVENRKLRKELYEANRMILMLDGVLKRRNRELFALPNKKVEVVADENGEEITKHNQEETE